MKKTVDKETHWVVEYKLGLAHFRNKFFSETDAWNYTNDDFFDGVDVRVIKREVVTTDTVLKAYDGDSAI